MRTIDELTGFANGLLDETAAADVSRHVDACADCAAGVVALRAERRVLERVAAREDVDGLAERVAAVMRPSSARVVRAPRSLLPYALAGGMLLVLALPFLQDERRPPVTSGQAAQDDGGEALRRHVQDFAKDGRAESKAAILQAGRAAIRIVYEERGRREGRAFDALTDILLTLRFKDETDTDALALRDALATRSMRIGMRKGGSAWNAPARLEYLLRDIFGRERVESDWYVDSVAWSEGAPPEGYPEEGVDMKAYRALDGVLAANGLDWAYRYGLVIVSTPARLWPRPALRPLAAADRERLSGLVGELDDPSVEVRERAGREILALGAAALDALKDAKASGEGQSRLAELRKTLEARHGHPVWDLACAMDRQKLEGTDEAVRTALNDAGQAAHSSFTDARLDAVLGIVSRKTEVRIACPDLLADLKIVSLPASKTRLRDALLLLTKTHGLDFYVEGGKVHVDLKSEVDKRVR